MSKWPDNNIIMFRGGLLCQKLLIKDLKNTSEIWEMCHVAKEPIYITKNGYGDMVIMSIEVYENTMMRLNMYNELALL